MAFNIMMSCNTPGQHLRVIAPEVIRSANIMGRPVTLFFNEISVLVGPKDTIERVVERYFSIFFNF
jgi:hypothetical protein